MVILVLGFTVEIAPPIFFIIFALMKKIMFLLLLAAGAASVSAQSALPVSNGVPQTTVKVYLTAERDAIKMGPYARWAQKYLGVIVPLADREEYTVADAKLDYAAPGHTPEGLTQQVQAPERDFGKVPIDRTSATKQPEEMAREAAEVIFKLRQQRLDILYGDTSELYPSGLDAALSEITRLENEYIELFLGKHTVTTEVLEYEVVPVAGTTEYVVGRFPDADGEQVTLTLTPENGAQAGDSKSKSATLYRVPDFAAATLKVGNNTVATARLPIYQFGATVAM